MADLRWEQACSLSEASERKIEVSDLRWTAPSTIAEGGQLVCQRPHHLDQFARVIGLAEKKPALCRAKVSGAGLIIAKLDRLSRNASFLLHLRDSGVRFIAADLPNADEMVVGIMAVIAQREREMIAQRTREALEVARKRLAEQGKALGNPNGAAALRRAGRGNTAAIAAVGAVADKRAEDLRETVADVVASGSQSHAAIAADLIGGR